MIKDGAHSRYPAYDILLFNLVCCSDALVSAALGTTSFDGITYSTTAETLQGVMVDGSTGVNHGEFVVLFTRSCASLTPSTDIAIDGNAVLLTVRID